MARKPAVKSVTFQKVELGGFLINKLKNTPLLKKKMQFPLAARTENIEDRLQTVPVGKKQRSPNPKHKQ